MKPIYYLLWWLADRELTIAMNTGRNPKQIEALRADVRRWEEVLVPTQLPPLFD